MPKYQYQVKMDYDNNLTVTSRNLETKEERTTTFTRDSWAILQELAKDYDTKEVIVNIATPPTKKDIKVMNFLMMMECITKVNDKILTWDYIKELSSDKNERNIENNNQKEQSAIQELFYNTLGIMEMRKFRKDPVEYCTELQHKIDLLGYDVSMSHNQPTPKPQHGTWTDGKGKHEYSRTTLDYNYKGVSVTDLEELIRMYMNSLYYFCIGLTPERTKEREQKDLLYQELYGMTYEQYQNEVYRIKGYCSFVYEGDNITTPLSSLSLSFNDRIYSSNN